VAREALGWKLGLERMHRLCSLLGMPQHRFASIHVVGTNGKTSVTRMTAALLEAAGARTGAYTSPHISDWRERIQIGGDPISEEALNRALERAEESAAVADRAAGEEGPVTQYELLTAAAFVAFAEARVEVGVIEAGLGGRLDATNVIPSRLTVLTSVGLDHTEWLGETLEEIAAEKLAVLRDHSTLLTGALPPEAQAVAEREAERRHAKLLWATAVASNLVSGYQAGNFALAQAAAAQLVERIDPAAALPVIERLGGDGALVPGRAQLVWGDPDVVYDAAHNPDGARALAETLPDLVGDADVVCCLAVLEGKDAGGIVEALAPACARFVCTEISEEEMRGTGRPDAESIPASRLAQLCQGAGSNAEAVTDPWAAWERATDLARERGGAALAAGSHYLLKCIWTGRHAESC
jgi:dihydrofolate synthase/folylpolyglutamate synthase